MAYHPGIHDCLCHQLPQESEFTANFLHHTEACAGSQGGWEQSYGAVDVLGGAGVPRRGTTRYGAQVPSEEHEIRALELSRHQCIEFQGRPKTRTNLEMVLMVLWPIAKWTD